MKKKENVLYAVPRFEEKKKQDFENKEVYTVKEALTEALTALDKENQESVFNDANKVLIIALNDQDGQYQTGFIQGGGMRMSEIISLLEVEKVKFFHLMGRI